MNWSHRNPGLAARIVPPTVVCVLSAAPALWIVHQAAAQHATADWKNTQAVVQTSAFQAANASSARIMPGCDLQYTYEANGARHTGSQLTTLGTPGVWVRGGPKGVASKYRTGDLVNIRYNPHNPTEAVLEAGLDGREVATAAAGVGVFGVVSAIALAVAIGGATRRTGRTVPIELVGSAFNRTTARR